jgi:hypothetical protein
MDNSAIDRLFQHWYHLNGAVMVTGVAPSVTVSSAETVVAESTAHARESGRLTWVVLDWLIRNIEQIDERRLLQETAERGDLSVLGVLCDLAHSRGADPRFDRLVAQCEPNKPLEMFFHHLAQYSVTEQLAREDPHEVFLRWGYLCRADEVHFLTETAAGVDGWR